MSNVASRLCDEAKPGQILISPRVLMAVERDVRLYQLAILRLRAFSRPVTAYNVLHAVRLQIRARGRNGSMSAIGT